MCPSGSSNSGDGDSYGGGGSGSGTPSWSGAGEGDRAPAPFAVLSSYQTGTVKTNLVNGSYSVQQSCTVEIRSDGLGGTKALQAVNGTAATTPLYISLFWATMNTECQYVAKQTNAHANTTSHSGLTICGSTAATTRPPASPSGRSPAETICPSPSPSRPCPSR